MNRLLAMAAATAAITLLNGPLPAADMPPIHWDIDPVERASSSDHVQLTLDYREAGSRSSISRPIAIHELAGLDAARLDGDRAPARFRIRRAAGTLDCSGAIAHRRGDGSCRFGADPAFADALAKRGIGRPTARQQFQLAMQGVGLDLVDELDRQGYARPAIDDLVAAGIHGISPDYVRAIAGAGYRVGNVGRLVGFRIHGVSAEWIRELVAANPRLARLPADDLVAMRIHGVRPAWVRELAALGYRDLDSDQLVAMRIHGVSPDFVRRVLAARSDRPDADRLVAMRIHGRAFD